MRELLQQSQTQTLDVRDEIAADISVKGFVVKRNDAHTLEVAVERDTSLNGLFEQLTAQQLNVISMRNKANRLEELFVSLVEGNDKDASTAA